jgi:hypothetical protein
MIASPFTSPGTRSPPAVVRLLKASFTWSAPEVQSDCPLRRVGRHAIATGYGIEDGVRPTLTVPLEAGDIQRRAVADIERARAVVADDKPGSSQPGRQAGDTRKGGRLPLALIVNERSVADRGYEMNTAGVPAASSPWKLPRPLPWRAASFLLSEEQRRFSVERTTIVQASAGLRLGAVIGALSATGSLARI